MRQVLGKKGLLLIPLLTAILAVQACSRQIDPEDSCNFVQNSSLQRVSWNGGPLKLYVHQSVPASAYSAIENAVNVWNHVIGGRQLVQIIAFGSGGAGEPQRDGNSVIYWFNTWDPKKPTEQARTTIYWTGNQIYEADIRINDYNFDYYLGSADVFGGVDLESLLVHEIGHALGLSHISAQPSVMKPSLQSGEPRRELSKVDIDSIRCEY